MPRKRFGRLLPTPEKLRSHKSLRWLGPLLHRPWLWQLNRRSVAAGVGIGVFFGFLIPSCRSQAPRCSPCCCAPTCRWRPRARWCRTR